MPHSWCLESKSVECSKNISKLYRIVISKLTKCGDQRLVLIIHPSIKSINLQQDTGVVLPVGMHSLRRLERDSSSIVIVVVVAGRSIASHHQVINHQLVLDPVDVQWDLLHRIVLGGGGCLGSEHIHP